MKTFSRVIPVLSAIALSGCNCDPPIVTGIAPQIYLDVCNKPQREVNGVSIGGFEECGFDFGARDISVKQTRNIKVTNPSGVELTLKDIKLIGDPSFKVELAPDIIGAGLSGDIIVSVRPNTETAIKTDLYIHSDANNTQQTPDGLSLIDVPITATGVDNGIPAIDVSPPACDFGRTPVGGVNICPVTIKNTGNRGLVLDSVEFVPPGADAAGPQFQVPSGSTAVPFAFVGRPPGPDEQIPPTVAPQQPITLQVRFTPDVLGNFQGKVQIKSNDPNRESINVDLSGISVTPPTCGVKIKSINNVDVGSATPAVQPLDNVILTLEDSAPSSLGGSIASYNWSIAQRPAGSTIQIGNPTGETTGFTFADPVGVDLAGNYRICGEVLDDLGTQSVNECCVAFEAIPQQHFLVQLSWDSDTGDIDLHAMKKDASGQFCVANLDGSGTTGPIAQECDSNLDCNWSTCKTLLNGGNSPEWDGVSGHTQGDPSLDIDDLDGFGPENINVDVMPGGDYLVGVHGYSTSVAAGCTLRLFIFGRLAGEFFNEINSPDWWEVAIVRWPDDITTAAPCVEDLTDGDPTDDCGP